MNVSESRHQWYDRCGNDVLYHHAQSGALEAVTSWSKSEPLVQEESNFSLLFATGAVYVHYMANSGLNFVLVSELLAAAELNGVLKSSLLFLTSLKLMSCEKCAPGRKPKHPGLSKAEPHCDIIALKFPEMPNVKTFLYSDMAPYGQAMIPDDNAVNSKAKSELRNAQIRKFQEITGVDPYKCKIVAMVVLNVKELMHIFRRIWQEFGPFPLIGCDSEGLSYIVNQRDPYVKREEITLCTSGFIITESNDITCDFRMEAASLVLSTGDIIEDKLKKLKEAGFKPENSWGIALSSCMRGYDGDDITNEHIEAKDKIQKKECGLFHEIVGQNYAGAQVEDVFGTNHIKNLYPLVPFREMSCDALGLFTPDIKADDSSTVFLAVKHTK